MTMNQGRVSSETSGQIDSRFLTAAAESLEFTERAETLEERYAALLRFLRTKMRYEGGRLR